MDLFLLTTIIAAALVVFIAGWLRVDLVGLLVLSALALTGLVSPQDALAGFSSPAVVTVWAMFILSAGLTRTGVAHQLGQPLQRFAKGSEAVLIIALMVAASLLSALINTVTVAAILLPATMELARRSGRPPSRLLMPLALGCLLGGPFTGISTPPNILATDALRNAGYAPFALLDFTPITAVIVAAGITFVVLIGRRMLPTHKPGPSAAGQRERSSGASYEMDSHVFAITIPADSPLDGRTLAESRIGSALFLTVVALRRKGLLMLAPRATDVLEAGDTVIVHGQPEQLQRFHGDQHLRVEPLGRLDALFCERTAIVEAHVGEQSPLVGTTLAQSGLRREHLVQVLRVRTAEGRTLKHPQYHRFTPGDRLLLQGEREPLKKLVQSGIVTDPISIQTGPLQNLRAASKEKSGALPGGDVHFLAVRVPEGSVLAGRDLMDSRLGNAFGLTVVSILRDDAMVCMPAASEIVRSGDLLVLQGTERDLELLKGLQELTIAEQDPELLAELESQQVAVTEVLLSPRTSLAGKTLADLMFRDQYGVSVLAVWRKGRAHRTGLQDLPLQFGDALLVHGPRRSLEAIARNPDFLVLDQAAAQAPRMEKAPVAVLIMLCVVLSAVFGLLPIAIAALVGSTLMVLLKCISMDEAYRAIEWKVVFLIACMLPLGVAVENTGAAQVGAQALISVVGDLGPRWVVAALFLVTVLGTQVIPTAALVVLMAPVALTTAETMAISPQLLMMTVAMSASSSYASPLSHPAHLLVMSPGGYRFVDYMKLGVPLTIISMLVCVWLLPVLFPA
ncbi:SLC13 family permease [Desulfonatronum sp. SC1]|uniref:SLC13 family permease n=1 Tax=Desulfonatronum sp. SC1 TaxID=2109626 RepID=UPI000D306323|nr:SLC13 family permease [Desulfonatronum sp. SC1]PTN33953.1 SLC13 family permease [Desulfonatronum sp. SC1]